MKIHFVGIGGIGVSALARYFLEKGDRVIGSDLYSSEIIEGLKKNGARIYTSLHSAKNLAKDTDLLIYSPAVLPNNPELLTANKLGIKCQSYPEALGELTKEYFTIAVSGTHGKSTTTAMIALILIKAGLNPTLIVGTKLKEFGNSNFRMGGYPNTKYKIQDTKYLVIEADEHFASFLNYWSKIIVLTNIEKDHLDYYKNLKNILKTFKEYIGHLPDNGILVANKEDKNIKKIILSYQFPIFNKFSIINFQLSKSKDVPKLKKILKVPGEHNVANALAALSVARTLKIPDKVSFSALSQYRGCWRRFEITKILHPKPYTLISDYAHHPTEIKTTLAAAREKYANKKIWCVFQPHQHQRTFYLFKDFVKVFKNALRSKWIDKLILTDIFDVIGRENLKIKKMISSQKIIKVIKMKNKEKIKYISSLKKTKKYLEKNLQGGEVVIIMGAGDIYKLVIDISSAK